MAKSIVDYVARFLASKFMSREDAEAIGVHVQDLEGEDLAVEVKPTQVLLPSVQLSDEQGKWIKDLVAPIDIERERIKEAILSNPPMSKPKTKKNTQDDAPPCHACGSITTRTGTCYTCMSCGTSSGCS